MGEASQAIVREDFAGQDLAIPQTETASIAIAAASRAQVEARHIMALRRPRDWDQARVKLLKECQRPGFAEAAIYRKPVGQRKDDATGEWKQAYVEGLSVRFAEAALRHVGNLLAESVAIFDDSDRQIQRVTVSDLETNATISVDVQVSKTVERRTLKRGQRSLTDRVNSYGDKVFIVPATDDEVLNKVNALVSKALRNCVLRLLPGDIQDECEEKCRAVMAQRDKSDPDAARKKLIDSFVSLGIMPDQLAEYLGHVVDMVQPAELQGLRQLWAAIRDGETTWAAVMEDRKPAEKKQEAPAAEGDKEKSAPTAEKPKAAAAVDELVAGQKKKHQREMGED